MKTARLIAVSSLLIVGALSVKAQDFATGYFLGGYQYAYRMNPAFASEHNFLSVGLGQFGANVQSDLGFSDFVKKDASGQYVLFLNDAISWDDFKSGLNPDINKLEMSSNVNLISRGKWNKEKVSFTTFDVAIKTTDRLDLPFDIFRFLKDGTSTSSKFDFGGTSLTSRNYLEIAYGNTRIIKNVFSFGFRLKALVGLANANLNMEQLNVDMSTNTWKIEGVGNMSASIPFATLGTDSEGYYDYSSFAINPSKITKNLGIGAAADFGVSINLLPWFTVSGAILDFGRVNWEDEIIGTANYTGPNAITYDTTTAASDGGQFDNFVQALKNIYKFKAEESTARTAGGKWEAIPYRVNAGAEIRVPFYQRLSVGALYTMYNGDFSFNTNDILLSANWTPINFLSASVSTRLGDQFKVFGAAVNLHPTLFNLFVGIDAVAVPFNLINIGALLPDSIPAAVKQYAYMPADDLNLNAYVGLSFAIGKRQIDYRKMSRQIIKEQKEKEAAKAQEKKEKEEAKAKEKELKEYERIQAEEAREAEKQAKAEAKAAKEAEKEAAKQAAEEAKAAKEAERMAKEQAAADAKAAKEAEKQAKAEAKAAKEAEKAAKAQEKAALAAEKAAAKNAQVEAAAAAEKAAKEAKAAEEKAAAEKAAAEAAAKEKEANAAEALLESALESSKAAEEPAPAVEEPKEEAPAKPATTTAAPTVFEFPNL
ncbi:MAG: hypothetical protein J5675_00970 [Bacteroidales bacterium]|nr:hypothetical protein [Bacteroidales bacterium]